MKTIYKYRVPITDRFTLEMPERSTILTAFVQNQAAFLWAERPLGLDDKAHALLTDDARMLIGALIPTFDANTDWNAASTEADVRAFAEAKGVKLGAVAQPLRAALTGRITSPPIFDVLAVLGKDESLARLRDQAA